MNREKRLKFCLLLLVLIKKHENRIIGLSNTVSSQDKLRYVEAYLLTPRTWYIAKIDDSKYCIQWAKKRYRNTITVLKQDSI